MDGRYNTRSPAVKRLMREAQELSEPTDQYFAQPLDDNLFEWHFTVRGPADSDFQNGIYHGRIILPVDYPMKPPSIIWLTPNGRFETHKKICLSISGHHPESWQPSWSIRTALLAIIGFMPTHPGGAIGSLDYTPEERKVLARKSKDWKCPTCGDITGILLDVSANTQATSNEAKELAAQINLQGEKPKCKGSECPVEQARVAEMAAEAKTSSGPASVESNNVSTRETTSNNSSTNAQGTQASFSPLPSPSTDQQTIPPFPQWSPFAAGAFPMPPMAFPFQYPGLPPVMMSPMQFPYPPSHYPAMPQYPWQPGMHPGGFSPPASSVNNSSNQEPNNSPGIDFSSNKNGQYSRSPMACPIANNRPQSVASVTTSSAETSNHAQSENSGSETVKNSNGQVFKELLSKVNRVGSEANVEKKPDNEASTAASASATVTSSKPEDSGSEVLKMVSKQKRSERVVKREKNEDGTGTDSEVSTAKCVKKSGVKSVSEMGDANTEDNSDSDVPPISVDKSPGLEKVACSSTSDLERWKQKYQVTKQLRQRQSATANVSTDLTEEGASTEPDRTEAGAAGRPKIEAVSGDTGARNRSRQASRLANNANLGNRGADVRENRQGSYDVGFYLMVGLFTTSMLILFNRLVAIDWSEL